MTRAPAAGGAPAPQAPRRWAWRAEYVDGSALQELDARGVAAARFEDIERARLARFGLVEQATRREALGFDCTTGAFTVRGHRLEFRLGELALTGREGASYRDVIQFKSAHTDWREGAGASGTVIDAHHLGYKVALPEAFFQVVLRLDARTGRVGIEAKLTPRSVLPQRAEDFTVLVDGARIASEAAFDAALRPGRSSHLASRVEVG